MVFLVLIVTDVKCSCLCFTCLCNSAHCKLRCAGNFNRYVLTG